MTCDIQRLRLAAETMLRLALGLKQTARKDVAALIPMLFLPAV